MHITKSNAASAVALRAGLLEVSHLDGGGLDWCAEVQVVGHVVEGVSYSVHDSLSFCGAAMVQ